MFTEHKNEARSFFAFLFGFFRSVRRFEVLFASFVLFGVLRFCLRELAITLIAFDKKGNAVPVQTGLRFFDRRRKRTSQSTCIRDDFDRSRLWAAGRLFGSACEMKCFCCITGTTFIYSFHENDFESPWH